MKNTIPEIQIIEGNSLDVFKRIAAFLSPDVPDPKARVQQRIIVERGFRTHYRFHQDMREALADEDADLLEYSGSLGYMHASWSPSDDGSTVKVAVRPRYKSKAGLISKEPADIDKPFPTDH